MNFSTQHRLLVMDLEIKREKKKKAVNTLPRIRWGDLNLALSREMVEKLSSLEAWSSDQMSL